MISHLVLLKPRPDLSESDRRAFVAAFLHAVRDIPVVRGVRVGRRITHGAGYEASMPDTADFVALIDFDDVAGLQSYLGHPAHEEVGALFGRLFAAALVYDFEVGSDLDAVAGFERIER